MTGAVQCIVQHCIVCHLQKPTFLSVPLRVEARGVSIISKSSLWCLPLHGHVSVPRPTPGTNWPLLNFSWELLQQFGEFILYNFAVISAAQYGAGRAPVLAGGLGDARGFSCANHFSPLVFTAAAQCVVPQTISVPLSLPIQCTLQGCFHCSLKNYLSSCNKLLWHHELVSCLFPVFYFPYNGGITCPSLQTTALFLCLHCVCLYFVYGEYLLFLLLSISVAVPLFTAAVDINCLIKFQL